MKKGTLKKSIALCCSITMLATSIPFTAINIKAATGDFFDENNSVMIDKGGYKKEVFGVRTDDWGVNWTDRKESLPPSKVYLTDNYKETVGTVPTNDWASSVVFDQYSESLYAHPLAYRAASNGMQMASPAVVDSTSYVDGEPTVESLLNDDTVEMVVGGENFSAKDAKVDRTTDWSYEIVMANNAGNSSMRSIIAKGTPYAYYTFDNVTPTISLGAGATDLGGISLSLFLGMAMITLKLWELASLALPLVILLAAQVVLICVFTYFVEFNIMGRDYDAAILVSGTCGFGMGATPNAMANMQAVCEKYVPSVKAYLLIPLVGSLFADFLNSLVITFFINIL